MSAIYGPVFLILDVAFFIMIAHIIMSWLISFQVLNLYQPLVAQIWTGLNRLLEPIYGPIRRLLPNTQPLDLSPLIIKLPYSKFFLYDLSHSMKNYLFITPFIFCPLISILHTPIT